MLGGLLAFVAVVAAYEQIIADEASEGYKEFAQGIDERRFADVAVSKVAWTHDPNEHLLNPMQMKIYEGRLYVWDFADTQLKVFGLSGRHVVSIGQGKGKAPGELQSLMDFFVRDGRVWILDGHERRISIFNPNGEHVKQILLETEGTPYRIAPLGKHLIIRQLAPTELFLEVDTTGQVLRRFGSMDAFMDRFDERNPLAFSGYLMTTGRRVLFGASDASYLHYFDTEGNMMRTVRTIDGQPYGGPPGQRERSGMRFSAPKPPIRYRAFTVQDDTIKMNAADYENSRTIIDYYTIGGQYLESVQLPEWRTVAHAHRGLVITNYKAELEKYRIVR